MIWTIVKPLHVAFALLTAASFAVRGYWMLTRSARLDARMTRMLPHVVDSLLLLTGLAMAVRLSVSPFAHPWFAAKLTAIVAYIVVGHVALKRGRSHRQRAVAFAVSLALLGYVFAVALTHDPWAGLAR